MREQIAIQNLIRAQFNEHRIKNKRLSLRSFAQKLNLAPSALSEILNGKRKISIKLADRILKNLHVSPIEAHQIKGLFKTQTSKLNFADDNHDIKNVYKDEQIDFLQLTSDQYNLICEWQHFAILSLLRTKTFRSDVSWIANRLSITTQQANAALDRLTRLGFIYKRRKNYCLNSKALKTSDNAPSYAVRKSHYQDLLLAEKALDQCPIELRDFTSNTISINTRQLDKARALIRQFQDELTLFLEDGPQDEVYKFTFYLYPLTKPVNES